MPSQIYVRGKQNPYTWAKVGLTLAGILASRAYTCEREEMPRVSLTKAKPNPTVALQLMKFPPKPKTKYVFSEAQDKRIFAKLNRLAKKTKNKDELLKLLYSQLEEDWRTPLEKFIDKLDRQR